MYIFLDGLLQWTKRERVNKKHVIITTVFFFWGGGVENLKNYLFSQFYFHARFFFGGGERK